MERCAYCSCKYDQGDLPACPNCGRGKPREAGMPFTKAEDERARKEFARFGANPHLAAHAARLFGPRLRDPQ